MKSSSILLQRSGIHSHPEPENENVKKGNQNPVSQQHKENQNRQKRPGTANDHGNQVPQKAENGEK